MDLSNGTMLPPKQEIIFTVQLGNIEYLDQHERHFDLVMGRGNILI
jgi:hypothetical protein